jgi:low affinity Fe/Cu permease
VKSFDGFARWCSEWTGHGWYFMLYVVGSFVAMAVGWARGAVMDTFIVWTALLTVTTQLQTILIQRVTNQEQAADKERQIKQEEQLKELGRAVPGAAEVIEDAN